MTDPRAARWRPPAPWPSRACSTPGSPCPAAPGGPSASATRRQDAWSLGGALDFAPGRGGHGVSVDLDTRLVSLEDGRSAGAGMEAEVGYGLWSGAFLGLVRPYVGLTSYPGEASIRRAVGVYLRDTPATHVTVELWEHTLDASTGLGLRARHRF